MSWSQRFQAVLAVVQDGWQVSEVARRLGVSRQSVHTWITRYEQGGLAALADRSHRPNSCPHQTTVEGVRTGTRSSMVAAPMDQPELGVYRSPAGRRLKAS